MTNNDKTMLFNKQTEIHRYLKNIWAIHLLISIRNTEKNKGVFEILVVFVIQTTQVAKIEVYLEVCPLHSEE